MIKVKRLSVPTFLKKLSIERADLDSIHHVIASLSRKGEFVEIAYTPRGKGRAEK